MRFEFNLSLPVSWSCCAAAAPSEQKPKKDNIQKPLAGPRATALRVTWLYVSPAQNTQKVDRVQPGREMVIAEKSGDWIRVYANTDVQEVSEKDAPLIGAPQDAPPPISGWMESKGVVIETTPNGDQVLMGEAANQESLASDPRGPAHAAQTARLLYRRVAEMFQDSPLAPEAAWRAADILWQIQKADISTRPSAHEKEAYMRESLDDEEMKKIIKFYPRTRQAALAAYALSTTSCAATGRASPSARKRKPITTRSTRLNIPMGRAPRRRFTRLFTARPCWWTCSTPTTATRKPTAPRLMRMNWRPA